MSAIKLGANCWNEYADGPSLLRAEQRVERLRYETLWIWDQAGPRLDRGKCDGLSGL